MSHWMFAILEVYLQSCYRNLHHTFLLGQMAKTQPICIQQWVVDCHLTMNSNLVCEGWCSGERKVNIGTHGFPPRDNSSLSNCSIHRMFCFSLSNLPPGCGPNPGDIKLHPPSICDLLLQKAACSVKPHLMHNVYSLSLSCRDSPLSPPKCNRELVFVSENLHLAYWSFSLLS